MKLEESSTGRAKLSLKGLELLCLDAGNTLVFLDHSTVAEVLRGACGGVAVEALVVAEGVAKRALSVASDRIHGDEITSDEPLDDPAIPPGWSSFLATMLRSAGITARTDRERGVRALWDEHRRFNLWRRVPEGLAEELRALRATGFPVGVVSNSEGMLDELFTRVGLDGCFDFVLDSALVGVEKPDPAIFRRALEFFSTPPASALHLGDTVATDVVGARRAGLRVGLLDPYGHYLGYDEELPRVPSVRAVAEALRASRATANE